MLSQSKAMIPDNIAGLKNLQPEGIDESFSTLKIFLFQTLPNFFFFVIITNCTSCLLHNQSQIICQLNTINVKGIRGISFYFPGDWWYVDHAKWYFFKGITTSCLIHILSNDLPPYEKHEAMKRILFSCPFANIALIFSLQ